MVLSTAPHPSNAISCSRFISDLAQLASALPLTMVPVITWRKAESSDQKTVVEEEFPKESDTHEHHRRHTVFGPE